MTVSADDVEREVRRIAAEQPDFVYDPHRGEFGSCLYFDGSEPSCIYGHAFAALGVDPALFEEKNSKKLQDLWLYIEQAAGLQPWYEIPVHQRGWLNVVQKHQDDDVSWGDAVAGADTAYPKTPEGTWPHSGQ